MAQPTARVLALLEDLQNGGLHPVRELAARLNVDERTVRRYVTHLQELGVPVDAVRGRYGGYRLAPGYRMPPLMLTDEEALAILLALTAAQRTGLLPTTATASEGADDGGRAIAKLRRVLPEATGRRLDALLETLEWTAPAKPPPAAAADASALLLFATAARDRRPVAISYRDRRGHASERTVLPYGIVAHAGRWYLAGQDSATGQVRTFRLDRISHPVLRQGTFAIPDGFDARSAVLESLATTPWRHEVRVLVEARPAEIRTRVPAGLALLTSLEDPAGWVRMDLRAERLDWLPPLLAGIGRRFKIEHPAELRDLVREYAAQLMADAT